MLIRPGRWKIWVLSGFVISILFTWLDEIFDLPHFIFNAPVTPVNWREAVIETVFTTIVMIICWKLVTAYELKWIEATKELENLAITDELSGMLNRRELFSRAESEFNRAKRFNQTLSIAMIDLDQFKRINDEYGHLLGDKVIRELAATIKQHVRQQDVAGRMGGDEFIIVFIETTREDAQDIGIRIQEKWQKGDIKNERQDRIRVTFSMGITEMLK
jgi:diguanylate cyclase (GGDEF)-like protein